MDDSKGFPDNHAPLSTLLEGGDVRVGTDKGEEAFPVTGGMVEVSANAVVVLPE